MIPKEGARELKYELTPFRTESDYQDIRHPEEIFWSDDLLLDVQRRDFRMNAIYYACRLLKLPSASEVKMLSLDAILKVLDKEGFVYFADQQVLIVQKASLITQLLPKGKIDSDFLYYLLDMQLMSYVTQEQEDSIDTPAQNIPLHILIDPALGIQSLIKKKLETVGEPDQRFGEDALRLLRALRFVNVLNHKLLTKCEI